MSTSTLNFSACFNRAWETYKKNALLLIGATAVASLVSSATSGILAGPMIAGLMLLMRKLLKNDSDAKFEDLFSQFDTFITTLLLILAWGAASYVVMFLFSMVIPVLGVIVAIAIGIAVSAFLLIAITLASDKKAEFKQASSEAFALVKANIWSLLGFTALAALVGGAGALICGFGVFASLPMYYLLMVCAIENLTATNPEEMIEIESISPTEPAAPAEAPEETPTEEPAEKPAEEKFADIDTDESVEIDEADEMDKKAE